MFTSTKLRYEIMTDQNKLIGCVFNYLLYSKDYYKIIELPEIERAAKCKEVIERDISLQLSYNPFQNIVDHEYIKYDMDSLELAVIMPRSFLIHFMKENDYANTDADIKEYLEEYSFEV